MVSRILLAFFLLATSTAAPSPTPHPATQQATEDAHSLLLGGFVGALCLTTLLWIFQATHTPGPKLFSVVLFFLSVGAISLFYIFGTRESFNNSEFREPLGVMLGFAAMSPLCAIFVAHKMSKLKRFILASIFVVAAEAGLMPAYKYVLAHRSSQANFLLYLVVATPVMTYTYLAGSQLFQDTKYSLIKRVWPRRRSGLQFFVFSWCCFVLVPTGVLLTYPWIPQQSCKDVLTSVGWKTCKDYSAAGQCEITLSSGHKVKEVCQKTCGVCTANAANNSGPVMETQHLYAPLIVLGVPMCALTAFFLVYHACLPACKLAKQGTFFRTVAMGVMRGHPGFGAWLSSSFVVVGMLLMMWFLHFMELQPGVEAALVCVVASIPLVAFLQFKGSKIAARKQKYVWLVAVGMVLPAIVGSILVAELSADFYLLSLTIAVGGPLAGFLVLVSWIIGDILNRSANSISFITAACCLLCFFPLGVVAPLVKGSSLSGSVTASKTVGTVALLFMVGVCTSTITLNFKLQKMDSEKKAKASTLQLRKTLKADRVMAPEVVARSLYDAYMLSAHLPNQQQATAYKIEQHEFEAGEWRLREVATSFREFLLCGQTVSWNENVDDRRLDLVLQNMAEKEFQELKKKEEQDKKKKEEKEEKERKKKEKEKEKERKAKNKQQKADEKVVADEASDQGEGEKVGESDSEEEDVDEAKPKFSCLPKLAFFLCQLKDTSHSSEDDEEFDIEFGLKKVKKVNTVEQSEKAQLHFIHLKKLFAEHTGRQYYLRNPTLSAPYMLDREKRFEQIFNAFAFVPEEERNEELDPTTGLLVMSNTEHKGYIQQKAFLNMCKKAHIIKCLGESACADVFDAALEHATSQPGLIGAAARKHKGLSCREFKVGLRMLAQRRYPRMIHAEPSIDDDETYDVAQKVASHVSLSPWENDVERATAQLLHDYLQHYLKGPWQAALCKSLGPRMSHLLARNVVWKSKRMERNMAKPVETPQQKFARNVREKMHERYKKEMQLWNTILSFFSFTPEVQLDSIDGDSEGLSDLEDLPEEQPRDRGSLTSKKFGGSRSTRSTGKKIALPYASTKVSNRTEKALARQSTRAEALRTSKPKPDTPPPPATPAPVPAPAASANVPPKNKHEHKVWKQKLMSQHKFQHLSWDECVDKIIASLESNSKVDAVPESSAADMPIEFTAKNMVALFMIALDTWNLTAILLTDTMPWKFSDPTTQAATAPLLTFPSLPNSYEYTFFPCVSVATVYFLLAIPSIRKARQGTLGVDRNGQKLKFPRSLYLTALSILGNALYFSVLLNLCSVVKCTGEPAVMSGLPSVTCWQGTHWIYLSVSVVAIVLYYPFASFMYPNIQFVDKGLDVKYSPTFLIFQAQGKLFLAGVAQFFPERKEVLLVSCFFVFGSFFLFTLVEPPCMVRRVNRWKSAGYLAGLWACVCTALVIGLDQHAPSEDQGTKAAALLICGDAVILLVTGYLHYRQWIKPPIQKVHPENQKHPELNFQNVGPADQPSRKLSRVAEEVDENLMGQRKSHRRGQSSEDPKQTHPFHGQTNDIALSPFELDFALAKNQAAQGHQKQR